MFMICVVEIFILKYIFWGELWFVSISYYIWVYWGVVGRYDSGWGKYILCLKEVEGIDLLDYEVCGLWNWFLNFFFEVGFFVFYCCLKFLDRNVIVIIIRICIVLGYGCKEIVYYRLLWYFYVLCEEN